MRSKGNIYVRMYSRRVTEPSGNKGVRKSEISVLKSSDYLRFDAVLFFFHEECAVVITMEHKLAC